MSPRESSLAPGAVTTEIGGIAIRVRSTSTEFRRLLERRYAGFVPRSASSAAIDLEVDLVPPSRISEEEELRVAFESGRWKIERGDFCAECDLESGRGSVRQSSNPYAIDSLLRVLHTLVLAREGGFLVHAASAVRGGRAFLFAGVSGAGKTTISRLAPPDAELLSDEISYLRRAGEGYDAYGTPFAGELASSGENVCAPAGGRLPARQGRGEPHRATRRRRRRPRASREHPLLCRGRRPRESGVRRCLRAGRESARVPPHVPPRRAGLGSGAMIGRTPRGRGRSSLVGSNGTERAADLSPGLGAMVAEQRIAATATGGAPVSARYVARSREIAARRLGEEIVVMSARDSTLFSLNEVAAVIWEAADGVTPLADIVERVVCSAYEVDAAQALRRRRGARRRPRRARYPAGLRSADRQGPQHEPRAGPQREGAHARRAAERPGRPHVPLQRALRALLPRPRGPRRDDHRRVHEPARSARRGGDLLPDAERRRDPACGRTSSRSSSTRARISST